jgi:hypothetical protein
MHNNVMKKKYDLIIYSRQQFECTSMQVEAANKEEAASMMDDALMRYHLELLEGEDPADYDADTLEEVAEEQIENEEYYLVCVVASDSDYDLVW